MIVLLDQMLRVGAFICLIFGYKKYPHFTVRHLLCGLLSALTLTVSLFRFHEFQPANQTQPASRASCFDTCRLEIVESIPENVTFAAGSFIPLSTYDAWLQLITNAETEIAIAAYKSSLRGHHVLPEKHYSHAEQGDRIFDEFIWAVNHHNITIKMVENYPPKDRGDNEDGRSLVNRGIITHRTLDFGEQFGTGTMHSKFLVVDRRQFYVGSANLDWRSLTQKMELGMLVTNCPCLAEDLSHLFQCYWQVSEHEADSCGQEPNDVINHQRPLTVQYKQEPVDVYLAASPPHLISPDRTWDLTALLDIINSAEQFIAIHVMDYIPMFVYGKQKTYWPDIDIALRRAAVERNVEIRLLTAALHFVPETLAGLQSLQAVRPDRIQIKIFKVPRLEMISVSDSAVLTRERRTHNKFMVTERQSIIGTSNWSGDYFHSSTGVAVVLSQTSPHNSFLHDMRLIFDRDWESAYAHNLKHYVHVCVDENDVDSDGRSLRDICEMEKPTELLNKKSESKL